LELVVYKNGEGLLRLAGDTGFPDMKEKRLKPRKKGDALRQKGITQPQAAKLKKVARFFDWLIKCNDWVCKSVAMITLSYGRDVPDDQTAKKHMRAFLERLRRYVKKKYGDDIPFYHIWCAELQEGKVLADGSESYRMKNGAAIHFHIVCPYFIPKGWLNDAWNGVAGGKQRLLPNVKAVRKPGNYVAKYLSKEGGKIEGRLTGSSYDAKQAVKAVRSDFYKNTSGKDSDFLMDDLAARVNKAARLDKDKVPGKKSDLACSFRPAGSKHRMLWTSNVGLLEKQLAVLLGKSAQLVPIMLNVPCDHEFSALEQVPAHPYATKLVYASG
jgi:hypothetical protein